MEGLIEVVFGGVEEMDDSDGGRPFSEWPWPKGVDKVWWIAGDEDG